MTRGANLALALALAILASPLAALQGERPPIQAHHHHHAHDHGEGRTDAVTHDLGGIHFGVSCPEEVQGGFDRALALLHHMMYEESRVAFSELAEEHPECAMAHWGYAMTLFQPLRPTRPSPEQLQSGHEAVARAIDLGPGSDRERALVAAAEAAEDPG